MFKSLSLCFVMVFVPIAVFSGEYSTTSDFNQGIQQPPGSINTSGDQLSLSGETSTFPAMWVANSGEDTLSKWDTENNKEVARYHTWFGPRGNHDSWVGPAPSRTAVDADGNCYVANRAFNGYPVVFKILLNSFVDRNNNGVPDTSTDLNNDGSIQDSEMYQITDSNNNGIIDPNEITDERIEWAIRIPDYNGVARGLAIDLEGFIWVGLYNLDKYHKLAPSNGAIVATVSVAGHKPYGTVIDKHGILWGASWGSNNILRLDTNTSSPTYLSKSFIGVPVRSYTWYGAPNSWYRAYGISVGYDANDNSRIYFGTGDTHLRYESSAGTFHFPQQNIGTYGISVDIDGNVVVGRSGGIAKYDSNGNVIWSKAAPFSADNRGPVVDSDNNIWYLVRNDSNNLIKVDTLNGNTLATRTTGRKPYTYSDATGLGLQSSLSQGSWIISENGGASRAKWGVISWDDTVVGNASVKVEVSVSDLSGAENFVEVTNGQTISDFNALTGIGQYLKVKVRLRAEDGDSSAVLNSLTVQQAPVAVCKDIEIALDALGNAIITAADVDGGSYDNDGTIVETSIDITSFTCDNLGENPITLTVTDNDGLTCSCPAIVTVVDNSPPQITAAPTDVELECSENGSAVTVLAVPEFSDNCAIDSVENDAPLVYPMGPTVVTWTAKDTSGNTSTAQLTVTVVDTTPPTLVFDLNPVVAECTGPDGTVVALDQPIFVDSCGDVTVTGDAPVGNIFPLGTSVVTWTAIDGEGNEAVITQDVTVSDTLPPVFDAQPQAIVVECGVHVELTPLTATDICGAVIVTNNAPTTFPNGETIVTWTATDGNDLTATVTQSVTVQDTIAPVLALTGDAELILECHVDVYNELGAIATDDCDDVQVVIGGDSVDVNTPGTYVVTYNATDASNNAAVPLSRTVVVQDTIAPVLALTGDADVVLECHVDSYSEQGATVTDDCDAGVAVVIGGDVVDVNTPGTYVVTYNATDASGNPAAPISRTVTVQDTIAPVLIVNGDADVTLECHVDVYAELSASVTDDCDAGVAVVVGGDTVDVNTPGVYVVTYNATDASGNSAATISRTVTVEDTTAPVIESAAASQDELWPPNHKMVPIDLTAVTSDLCQGDTVTCTIQGVEITSNEPENDNGDGNTEPDWEITGNMSLLLRAERAGPLIGREYTITVICTDASGNSSEPKTVIVTVPKDQGNGNGNGGGKK